ncbi:MAG: Unknown protein [uncultured Sulfurovum sp.]|uniref:Lipoprotein n=1 Tax=uncultured Sulfurovum sp. TaxID=269237 RepID=A0A6S6UAL0_9BACT|nr:MAG: Unknown protein [uncultured Sulfurovum sp.]
MKIYRILGLSVVTVLLSGCVSSDFMNTGKRTIYPCSIGCGDKRITPPKGYVYYNNRVMKLSEFNRITGQNIVVQ